MVCSMSVRWLVVSRKSLLYRPDQAPQKVTTMMDELKKYKMEAQMP